jgi:hypothetical protein
MFYKDEWNKAADAQFASELKSAKEEGRSSFAVEAGFGIFFLIILGVVRGIKWLFFASPPTRDDLWWVLWVVVGVPICERIVGPMREARELRAKRAIRIEMKLDALLKEQETLAEEADRSDARVKRLLLPK